MRIDDHRGMAKTLLDKVRHKLSGHAGAALEEVATRTGVSYDTLLRIRDGRTDPAFGKVQRLAEYLKLVRSGVDIDAVHRRQR